MHIIEMQKDEEGFLYPKITDSSKCIDCKKCEKVCPVKNAESEEHPVKTYRAGSMNDAKETASCASGGLGTALNKAMIEAGGVVYGVSYSEDFKEIVYRRAEKAEQLNAFKTSKYAQARKGDVYAKVAADLKNGREVLFIGLPCEVYALRLYIGADENLYTVGLICHGPTSQKVHGDFVSSLEKKENSRIKAFSVRYKLDGNWKPYYTHAEFENGNVYNVPFHESEYGVAFRYLKRPSCNVCRLKLPHLYADLTIGDYHYAHKGMESYDPAGVSVAMVHTDRGQKLLDILKEFKLYDIDKRSAQMNEALLSAIPEKKARGAFVKTLSKNGLGAACSCSAVCRNDKSDRRKAEWKRRIAKLVKKVRR